MFGTKLKKPFKESISLEWFYFFNIDYLKQIGVPKGIRTPVAGVKGRCPGPG